MDQHAARKDPDIDMWRLLLISPPCHGTRLNGLERELAILRRTRAPEPSECPVGLGVIGVRRMVEKAVCVRLPDFHHCIRNRVSITVQHPTSDCDTLACSSVSCQDLLAAEDQPIAKERANCMAGRLDKSLFFLHRNPLLAHSNGVWRGPQTTISKRKPRAHSGV